MSTLTVESDNTRTIVVPRVSDRRRGGNGNAPTIVTTLAWGYAVLCTYPLLWLVLQSFRADAEILGQPWGLPMRPTADAYATAFQTTPLAQYFVNSLLVTVAVVCLVVACCAGAGYALSKLRFPGSDYVLIAFVGVLVLPAPILLLPVFLISNDLGIINTHIGLIGPYAAGGLPLGIFLMKTHFDAIPASYAEAAEIDRASAWQIFRLVMLPLVGPAAATVAVLAFMSSWNEYIYALVSIRSDELFTLPIGIADLSAKRFLSGYAPVFAAMVVTALPVYIAFIAAQRVFIRSLAIGGGVKG